LEKSAFCVLDAPASGLASKAAGCRAFCDFHLSHRIKAGVFSLSSKSLKFTVNAHSVMRKFRSSETVHTQSGKRRRMKITRRGGGGVGGLEGRGGGIGRVEGRGRNE